MCSASFDFPALRLLRLRMCSASFDFPALRFLRLRMCSASFDFAALRSLRTSGKTPFVLSLSKHEPVEA